MRGLGGLGLAVPNMLAAASVRAMTNKPGTISFRERIKTASPELSVERPQAAIHIHSPGPRRMAFWVITPTIGIVGLHRANQHPSSPIPLGSPGGSHPGRQGTS